MRTVNAILEGDHLVMQTPWTITIEPVKTDRERGYNLRIETNQETRAEADRISDIILDALAQAEG